MGQPQMPAGAVPQAAQLAPSPQATDVGLTSLPDIERALTAVKAQLHGSVWAVGELAVAGMASSPLLMVSSEKDLGPVTAIMQALSVHVLPGHPGQMPSLALA